MRRCLSQFMMLVMLAVSFLVGGVGPGAAEGDIKVAASRTALLFWIAAERGFFEEEGLHATSKSGHVRPLLFQSGLAAGRALLTGAADLSTTADSAFVSLSVEHPNLRILASISASEISRLVARRDRGISSAADLVGKRVGVTVGSAGEFLLGRYLTLNRVPLGIVELVDLKPAAIVKALVSGDIDAGLTWEPFIHDAEVALGDNGVVLPGQEGQHYYFLVVTTEEWIARNRDAATKIVRALIRAENFAIENQDAAKALIAEKFGYERAYLDHLWPLHSLHVSLPQDLLFMLEESADWRMRKGLVKRQAMPNFVDLIDAATLRAVNPIVVGILP